MGKQSIWDKIKEFIGGVGFWLFLWSIGKTDDEYIEEINKQYYQQLVDEDRL